MFNFVLARIQNYLSLKFFTDILIFLGVQQTFYLRYLHPQENSFLPSYLTDLPIFNMAEAEPAQYEQRGPVPVSSVTLTCPSSGTEGYTIPVPNHCVCSIHT